tara:strand:+ start:817 stop:4437 length:3621 start_codon:yes stop_codon:yes gene_type:complete
MAEGELKIISTSVVKTTEAVDALIKSYEKLAKIQGTANATVQQNTTEIKKANDGQAALKNALQKSNIARDKALSLLELERKGLGRNSEEYANLKGTILATEQATRSKIAIGSKEYTQLEKNLQVIEKSAAQQRALAQQAKDNTKATKSNTSATKQSTASKDLDAITAQKNVEIYELLKKGLNKSSKAYADARAAILAKEKAAKRGIKTDSKEYKELLRNIRATERSTAATKALSNDTSNLATRLKMATHQVQLIDGPLGGVASRMTALASIMRSGGGAVAGFGVLFGVGMQQLYKGSQIAADTEVALVGVKAQLEATGYASGFMSHELDDMARSFAYATLDSVEGVREIQDALLVFKGVSGDTFKEAIALSQDFAIANKKNAKNVARLLGRALQDPLKNYKTLRELGIQIGRDDIKRLKVAQQQNDLVAAQTILTDKLRGSIGRVAEAQADTLRGDQDTLGQAYDEAAEMLGRKFIPIQREATSAGISFFQAWTKGSKERTSKAREFIDSLKAQKANVSQLTALTDKYNKKLKTTEGRLQELQDKGIATGNTVYNLKRTEDQLRILIPRLTEYRDQLIATKKAGGSQEIFSDKELDTLEVLERKIDQQKRLTLAFEKSGDTQSKAYRTVQAEIKAENLALKSNSNLTGAVTKKYQESYLALSELSTQRAKDNAIVQQSKALSNQTRGLELQIELLNLQSSGLSKNSDEYIIQESVIKARNKAISAGIDLESDKAKTLLAEADAVARLTVKMKKQAAMQGQINQLSSRQVDNEKQIAIMELQAKGLNNTSVQYQRELALINARSAAIRGGFADDETKVALLEKEAVALGKSNAQLQQMNTLKTAGVTGGSQGFTFERPEAQAQTALFNASSALENIDPALISDAARQLARDYLVTLETELQNGRLNPLGLIIDQGGMIAAIESEKGILIQRNTDLAALELEARELGIIQGDETLLLAEERRVAAQEAEIEGLRAFLEKRNGIIIEADEAVTARSVSEYKNSESHKESIRAKGLSDEIKKGAEGIANLKGNSKAAARIAKAAALFSASVSFVDGLSQANATKGDPITRAIAYAQAMSQGISVVSAAQGLSDPSFAFGGVDIQGRGTGRSDDIKANLSRGESVITAPATARFRDDLERMNAGLAPKSSNGGGSSFNMSINIEGDASEATVGLIEDRLQAFEARVQEISSQVSVQAIQEESQVGGILNTI